MAEAQPNTKLSRDDFELTTVTSLPAATVITPATAARSTAFTITMKQASFGADHQDRLNKAMHGDIAEDPFSKLDAILRILRQIEGRDQDLFKLLQTEPDEEKDTTLYKALHDEGSAKAKAWHLYTAQVASELIRSYPDQLDKSVLTRKGPLTLFQRLLSHLGFSTFSMVAEMIHTEQQDLALDLPGFATHAQLVDQFHDKTAILAELQVYFHGFRSEAGGGDLSRWYTETFSVKTLIHRLTLPAEFKTPLDQFDGDIGETNEAFDGLFGWLTREATKLDATSRKRDKQRKATSTDSTFAAHSDHDGHDFAEAVRRQKQSTNPGYVGIHCNGSLERKSRGLWHYDGIEVQQQDQIKVYQGTPVWCDRAGKPRICSEIDKSNRMQCTGVHPRAVCPVARKNDRNVYQPNLYRDTRKEHGKKRKAEADPRRVACKFWSAPGGCRKGHECRFAHQGKRGQGKRAKKKPQQHQTNGVINAATLQAIVQAVHAVQHPPPTKGDGEDLSTE